MNLAYRTAYEMVEELKPEDQLKKMQMFALLEMAGNDYKKLCETLSALYLSTLKDESSAEKLSEFTETYLRKTINAIDPHTFYLDEKEWEETQNRLTNQFTGLGMEFHPTGENGKGPFVIKRVIPNSPAMKQGLQADDLILKAETEECSTFTTPEFLKWIEKQQEKFSFEILRGDQKLTIADLSFESFFWPTVEPYFINNQGLAYIRIYSFAENTGTELSQHIETLRKAYGSDLKGILLDLRNNRGGLLSAALATSDLFLNEGRIHINYKKNDEQCSDYIATAGTATDAPLFILINNSTCSASEIVGSALQDHGRAILLGERSYGKGTVLRPLILRNGESRTATFYTEGVFYRPTGETIQRQGVTPDIEIVDPGLKKAVEALGKSGTRIQCRESDYEQAIVAEPKPMAFEPTSSYRDTACKQLLGRSFPTEYSEIEKKDIQLTKAIEYLKLFTEIPIAMNHFSFAHFYPTPEPRLHINCDLYKKEQDHLPIHIQFFNKDRLIHETRAFLSGQELTLPLKDTPVETFVKEKGTGSFILKIEIQDQQNVTHTHQTIVVF